MALLKAHPESQPLNGGTTSPAVDDVTHVSVLSLTPGHEDVQLGTPIDDVGDHGLALAARGSAGWTMETPRTK